MPEHKPGKVYVTREFTFDAAHRLHEYEGICAQSHGHTYKLQVTVCGKAQSDGILIDFSVLKTMVEQNILKYLDHRDITEYFDHNEGMNTTVENLCVWIYTKMNDALLAYCAHTHKDISICKVTLWETPKCKATYRG